MQNIHKSEGKQKQSIPRFKINPRSPGSKSLAKECGKLEVKGVNKMNAQYMEMKRQCDSYISWMESPTYPQQKETTKRSVILDASAIQMGNNHNRKCSYGSCVLSPSMGMDSPHTFRGSQQQSNLRLIPSSKEKKVFDCTGNCQILQNVPLKRPQSVLLGNPHTEEVSWVGKIKDVNSGEEQNNNLSEKSFGISAVKAEAECINKLSPIYITEIRAKRLNAQNIHEKEAYREEIIKYKPISPSIVSPTKENGEIYKPKPKKITDIVCAGWDEKYGGVDKGARSSTAGILLKRDKTSGCQKPKMHKVISSREYELGKKSDIFLECISPKGENIYMCSPSTLSGQSTISKKRKGERKAPKQPPKILADRDQEWLSTHPQCIYTSCVSPQSPALQLLPRRLHSSQSNSTIHDVNSGYSQNIGDPTSTQLLHQYITKAPLIQGKTKNLNISPGGHSIYGHARGESSGGRRIIENYRLKAERPQPLRNIHYNLLKSSLKYMKKGGRDSGYDNSIEDREVSSSKSKRCESSGTLQNIRSAYLKEEINCSKLADTQVVEHTYSFKLGNPVSDYIPKTSENPVLCSGRRAGTANEYFSKRGSTGNLHSAKSPPKFEDFVEYVNKLEETVIVKKDPHALLFQKVRINEDGSDPVIEGILEKGRLKYMKNSAEWNKMFKSNYYSQNFSQNTKLDRIRTSLPTKTFLSELYSHSPQSKENAINLILLGNESKNPQFTGKKVRRKPASKYVLNKQKIKSSAEMHCNHKTRKFKSDGHNRLYLPKARHISNLSLPSSRKSSTSMDLRKIYPENENIEEVNEELNDTSIIQPIIDTKINH